MTTIEPLATAESFDSSPDTPLFKEHILKLQIHNILFFLTCNSFWKKCTVWPKIAIPGILGFDSLSRLLPFQPDDLRQPIELRVEVTIQPPLEQLPHSLGWEIQDNRAVTFSLPYAATPYPLD